MGYHHFSRGLGSTGLDGDDGLAQLPGDLDGCLEGPRVGHRLHIESERRDPILSSQGVDCILEVELQHVPQRHHVRNRKTTPLHGEVETHVRRHGDDGNAFVDASAALLVGPERRPVEVVDESVAIWPDQGHIPGGLQKLRLELRTLLARLDEAGRVADCAARIPRSEIPDDVDGEVAIDAEIRSVGASRQLLHRSVDLVPQNLRLLGMDRPDLPFVSQAIVLANQLLGVCAAENGDGTRFQETLK